MDKQLPRELNEKNIREYLGKVKDPKKLEILIRKFCKEKGYQGVINSIKKEFEE